MMKKKMMMTMALVTGTAWAGNLCPDGIADAVPLRDGRTPVIDGKLDDWDLSAEEPCWNAEQYADRQYAILAFMYDEANFYISARMGLYDHAYVNDNRPGDRYWQGDLVQVRLCTDPTEPHPLRGKNPKDGKDYWRGKDTVTCVNIWKNTKNGEDNLYITPGAHFDCENVNNPAGSAIRIVTDDRAKTAVIEARVPWRALSVKDGKNPFKPGEMMTGIVDVKWSPGSDGHYTTVIFEKDPGAFAFLGLGSWGRIRFSPKGNLPGKPKTLAQIAKAARDAANAPRITSTPITVKIPKAGKLSVNIFDEQGGVIQELIGGEYHEAGDVTVYWDGRDGLGFPCETGKIYTWKAYLHDGLDWEYVGTVGTSGTPPYVTPDGKGCWGGDHGPAIAAAADETGRYFAWHMSEAGRGLVKTDFDGNVIWRSSPFVAGGYCPFTSLAAAEGKVWIVLEQGPAEKRKSDLIRLDAATGNYELFPDGRGAIPLALGGGGVDLPIRQEFCKNNAGCVYKDGMLYISDFVSNRVLVVSAETGAEKGSLAVADPRGLCLAPEGDALYVAQASGTISRLGFDGSLKTLVDHDLVLPQGVACDAEGNIWVTDLGESQQLKKFEKGLLWGWNLAETVGRKGGRPSINTLDKTSFLYPSLIAVDKTGMILVPEMAPPKIVNLVEAKTARIVRKYYGYTSYAPTTFADCDDPREIYYSLAGPNSFAKAILPEGSVSGLPVACWDYTAIGSPFDAVCSTMNTPYVFRAKNGVKYLVADGGPGVGCSGYKDADKMPYGTWARPVCRVDKNDVLTPVACAWVIADKDQKKNFTQLRVWTDRNDDGRISDDELGLLVWHEEKEDAKWASQNGAFFLDADGNGHFVTQTGRLVRLDNLGWTKGGAPVWDASKPELAIPEVLPGTRVWSGWRMGFLGCRRDAAGNYYAAINTNVRYPTEAYAKYMHQGMGHTADMNAVFMTKYSPDGNLVWRTGRKAVGGAKPGEILHHWNYAGLINDAYTVGSSEWACLTFYTTDGFYVDRIFDTPGLPPAEKVGPQGMGGEDFSGSVSYYPDRDEVWAYDQGHAFRVLGFKNGRVSGEWRTEGTVKLEKVEPLEFVGKKKPLGDVKLAVEGDTVVFSAPVVDDSPLANQAGNVGAAFKGGDAVGFEVGPTEIAAKLAMIPERKPSGCYLGFARVLAYRAKGKDVVVGFKPFTDGEKKPISYETPAGGKSDFEFVGEIPGATVEFVVDGDKKGYTATVKVPKAFFELDFAKGYAWEAEALFSGNGPRGFGTIERCYLNNEETSQTTMTDDTPTESRLYTKGWKAVK